MQPDPSHSVQRAMRVIYPALLVAWLAFPAPVRDWAEEQVASGWMPQAVMPLFETVRSLSEQLHIAGPMQDMRDRINARLDAKIR
jgi:hypothetical protein